ncbi:MAG: (Fe-S)-binding protein [Desulfarculales bacterium]|jgi:glycolate oxidase iron-sulfur subunit|nr:(Fe-S)-binding protein [Desulfarculales bacterium]
MDTRQSLLEETCARCIQCGACKAVCPVHLSSRREEHSPRGRLNLYQALLQGKISFRKKNLDPLWQCLLCGRCQRNCPNLLRVTDALKQGRAGLLKKNPALGRLLSRLLLNPALPALVKSIPGKGFLDKGLNLRWQKLKRLPPLRPRPPSLRRVNFTGRKKVGLFLGCLATYARPGLAEKALAVLRRLDYQVIPLSGCCGLAALSAGQHEPARHAALTLRENWQKYNLEGIVTLCTSCTHTLSQEYALLLPESTFPEIMDINFLLASNPQLLDRAAVITQAYLHLSCHLPEAETLHKWLMSSGIKLTVIDHCCGGGGLLPFNSPQLSRSIAPRLPDSRRPVLVTCSGCYLQWLQIHDGPVIHPLETLSIV